MLLCKSQLLSQFTVFGTVKYFHFLVEKIKITVQAQKFIMLWVQLPPGGNFIFTARIRRIGKGNIFTLCVSPHLDWKGGGALSFQPGGILHPRSGQWGTPSQAWMGGGYVIRGQDGGYPGVSPWTGWDPPSRTRWGYPPSLSRPPIPIQDWMGYPPSHPDLRWGTPPHLIRRQSSTASTCYVAVGMPLAFTWRIFLFTQIF